MISGFPLDITRIPFSRQHAGCMIFYEENGAPIDAENGMYLSQSVEGALMGGAQFLRNKNYLLMTPVIGDKPVEYTYCATMSKITINAAAGTIEITFDCNGAMRIRARKLGIRLTAKMGFGDVAALHDRNARIDMDNAVYYIVPQTGAVTVDSHYNLLTYRYSDPIIELIPDNEILEVAVYDKADCVEGEYIDFDDCVSSMEKDINAFADGLVKVPEGMETLIYGLWIAEKPFREQRYMYPSNVISAVYPIAKEQPVLSLPFSSTSKATELITNFAEYVTKQGLVPEYVNRTLELFQTESMDYGYAALELLKKGTPVKDDAAKIYDFLATVNRWWTDNRSNDGGTSFFYAYNFECGDIKSSIIKNGTPAITPDLMTRMILLADALAQYAELIGAKDAADLWKEVSESRYNFLMDKLWKNGRFVSMITDGSEYESDSLLCFMPILLHAHMCKETAKLIADTILDKFFVTGKGLTTEADGNYVDSITMSVILSGIADAGFDDIAKSVAKEIMIYVSENGLYAKYAINGAPEKRCAALYQPAVCAAMLAAMSKIL